MSSGDDGAGGVEVRDDTYTCYAASPSWPASSPYVTAVGATQLTEAYTPVCSLPYATSLPVPANGEDSLRCKCSGTGETVCSSTFGGIITSGGGFSDYYNGATTAPWQTTAVASYVNNALQPVPSSFYNKMGRAYPDISAYGSNFFVFLGGQIVRESGTSASAPVMAAIVTLWNDMRLAYGLPPLGFLNPFLYQAAATNPEAFNDVTTGQNDCAAGFGINSVNCCPYGFPASAGWDASTGLGSPNYQVLASLVLDSTTTFPASVIPPAVVAAEVPTASSDSSSTTNDVAGAAFGIAGLAVALILAFIVYALYRQLNAPRQEMRGETLINPVVTEQAYTEVKPQNGTDF